MEGAKQNYWEVEYKDFVENAVIRFRKMNSLDLLDLADRNINKSGDSKEFKLDCLRNVLWTKDGSKWFDLMDEDGNVTLPELTSSALLDIFFKFRSEVCLPVFTESKTYQTLQEQSEAIKEAKVEKHKKQQ